MYDGEKLLLFLEEQDKGKCLFLSMKKFSLSSLVIADISTLIMSHAI